MKDAPLATTTFLLTMRMGTFKQRFLRWLLAGPAIVHGNLPFLLRKWCNGKYRYSFVAGV